jgi:hypothetical protein
MKKLELKLDDLQVETFTTAERPAGRGTVEGHYGTTHTQAGETCDVTCAGTCRGYDTCFVSCQMTQCWQGNQCVVW